MSGTRAASFSLLGSKKWIIREGRNGISRSGVGAPTASGAKKSFGLRIDPDPTTARPPGSTRAHRNDEGGAALVEFAIVLPVLVTLVLGLLTGGIAVNKKLAITNGVREASRYGATLPVGSAPACANGAAASLACWLTVVADAAQQGSEGELNHSSRSICVAYRYPNGTTATDQNMVLVRPAVGSDTITTGSTTAECFADGRAANERRVQVTGSRTSKLEFLVGSRNLTLLSKAVTRYEGA